MKILVIGAGVLGSYLAHVLHRGGSEVTLLARGARLDELREKGLVIRHYAQLTTTTDYLPIVDRFDPEEQYDIVFVVVQRNQLDDLLTLICTYRGSGIIVFVGNNPTADQTQKHIEQNSAVPRRIVFGFQASAGRREQGKIISLHPGFSSMGGRMVLGSLTGDNSFQPVLLKAFYRTKYKLIFSDHMDAWLKHHVAFVMPLCFAVYYSNGNLRRIAGEVSYLKNVILSMKEATLVVESLGYPIEPPENEDYFKKNQNKLLWMLRLMAATPLGRLVASDHAMYAREEMQRLYSDFCKLIQDSDIPTPAWNELSRVMQ